MIDDPGLVPGGVVDCLTRDRQAFMKASDVGDTPLAWVAWFNNHRLLEPIGYIPPAEAESS